MNYNQSIKAAIKNIAETERRMEELQSLLSVDLDSVQFLLDANKVSW
jgi:hypothetical protein